MAGPDSRFDPTVRQMRATAIRPPAEPGQRTSLPCVNPSDVSTRRGRLLKDNGFGKQDQLQRHGKQSSRNGPIECTGSPSSFAPLPELIATRVIIATVKVF